ncbi:laccase [Salvia divinorum]|uniref:Laccase n=1 Tax=Salvia divinorum TaxID=28513 RepID=A0ABD1HEI1_SALDI
MNILLNLNQINSGEWWNADVDAVESEMSRYGGGPNSSYAYTNNGLPGPLFPCSIKGLMDHNKHDELFFAVANHTLTVVEITKPFTTSAIMITPGQTTTLLLTADKSTGAFVMAARPYLTSVFPFNNSTTIGYLKYTSTPKLNQNKPELTIPPNLPAMEEWERIYAVFASSPE